MSKSPMIAPRISTVRFKKEYNTYMIISMRIALVHDYLNQYGGAERVLEVLMEMFPDAPIYTLLHDPEKTLHKFKGRVRKTSILDFPLVRRMHRPFIPLMPIATELLRIGNEYDVVISSSASFAKGVRNGEALHICYCHTPIRYAWEPEYLDAILPSSSKKLIIPLLWLLRWWDKKAAQKLHLMIANSEFIAEKIKRHYNRTARVIYPPVDMKMFYPDKRPKKKTYFLALGRMLHYKRFDLVIQAFNELGLPLKVVGNGPELEKLKMMSYSPHTEFLPFVEKNESLREIYAGAKALIFPQTEDFGLVAAEAIACGTPVVAYNAGGAKEIVIPKKNGLLFNAQTPEAIISAVAEFKKMKFAPKSVAKTAQRFSKEKFKAQILELLAPFAEKLTK